jgi:FkbM family methyltransferase
VLPWKNAKGDETLRVDYNLEPESLVFDIGAYKGNWTSDIFSRYCCEIHAFEVVEEFATAIDHRFGRNPKIHVYNYGLSAEDGTAKISVSDTSSSVFGDNARQETIAFRGFQSFMGEKQINHIDLMKINIEGGEYDLLEHILDTPYVARIGNFQIQFHDFVPNAEKRMSHIQQRLSKTHVLTYQYPFIWENWHVKV